MIFPRLCLLWHHDFSRQAKTPVQVQSHGSYRIKSAKNDFNGQTLFRELDFVELIINRLIDNVINS